MPIRTLSVGKRGKFRGAVFGNEGGGRGRGKVVDLECKKRKKKGGGDKRDGYSFLSPEYKEGRKRKICEGFDGEGKTKKGKENSYIFRFRERRRKGRRGTVEMTLFHLGEDSLQKAL